MRRSWRSRLVALICLSLTAYFTWHAIRGRHGFEARFRLIERSSMLAAQIGSLEVVRARLQLDVALLSPELAHPDLVEEIAADVLGYHAPEDMIVRSPATDLR